MSLGVGGHAAGEAGKLEQRFWGEWVSTKHPVRGYSLRKKEDYVVSFGSSVCSAPSLCLYHAEKVFFCDMIFIFKCSLIEK